MLPTDNAERKALPLWDFMFGYFPDAWVEVAKVAVSGNEQHNPGEPLHWAREKSTDQLNTAFRHLFDHGKGQMLDTDECYHLAKAIWRLSAELQLIIEQADTQLFAPVADLTGETIRCLDGVERQVTTAPGDSNNGCARCGAGYTAAVGVIAHERWCPEYKP